MELKGLKIAFLGDSITEGVGASTPDKIYHQVLKERAGLKAAVNYGIRGTRIARQSIPSDEPSFDKHFITRVPEMDEDEDAIVVFGGINDFGHGDAPLGKFEDRCVHTFYGALHMLMQKLIGKYPEKPIIFMTPLHRVGELIPSVKPDRECQLSDYVRAICEVAGYYSVPVLNLYAVSGMSPNVEVQQQLYFPDGLHPSDKGHERIGLAASHGSTIFFIYSLRLDIHPHHGVIVLLTLISLLNCLKFRTHFCIELRKLLLLYSQRH